MFENQVQHITINSEGFCCAMGHQLTEDSVAQHPRMQRELAHQHFTGKRRLLSRTYLNCYDTERQVPTTGDTRCCFVGLRVGESGSAFTYKYRGCSLHNGGSCCLKIALENVHVCHASLLTKCEFHMEHRYRKRGHTRQLQNARGCFPMLDLRTFSVPT